MLARRFTIVCLLMTLFGMLFAILVAEAEPPGPPFVGHRHALMPPRSEICLPIR